MLRKFYRFISFLLLSQPLFVQQTAVQDLSDTGKDATFNWDFQGRRGRNSGKWTSIPAPSNWELQGFGIYHYGNEKEDSLEYKHAFAVPAAWQQKRIFLVFDGAITDTEVRIAGPVQQGAYYQFRYDITPRLRIGQEVRVSEMLANRLVNEAERGADFWVFGGSLTMLPLTCVAPGNPALWSSGCG